MKERTQEEWAAIVRCVADAETNDFTELVTLAGLDPRHDLQFGNFEGVPFRNRDVSRYNLTGAWLSGCDFSGANLTGSRLRRSVPDEELRAVPGRARVRFDRAILGRVIHRPGRDPHAPAEMTPIANLREAADWDEYANMWHPGSLTSDAHLPVGAIFQDAPFAPEMVVVPAGSFMMGSPDGTGGEQGAVAEPGRLGNEGPRHLEIVPRPFAIGRFAVTNREWQWFVSRRGGDQPHSQPDASTLQKPAVHISWHDAASYVHWLAEITRKPYRLLSEVEWEYCCRAGTETAYHTGPEISPEQAQYSSRAKKKELVDVGSFPGNAWGIHDMHGGVGEWCQDQWSESYGGRPVNHGGAFHDRVVRGGAWDYPPEFIRSAYRGFDEGHERHGNMGFRVARDLEI